MTFEQVKETMVDTLGCDEDIQSVLDKNYAFEKVSSIY